MPSHSRLAREHIMISDVVIGRRWSAIPPDAARSSPGPVAEQRLFRVWRARFTFSRISVARAVQMKGGARCLE